MEQSDIFYFLYRNESAYARDADESSNTDIDLNPFETCGKKIQLLEDIEKVRQIRHNIYSIYSRTSTAFVLLIMVLMAAFSAIIVPYYLKEYAIPAILRMTNDNMFFSTMRIRTLTYFAFMICAGCLSHLNFYVVQDECLHTQNPDPFGLVWTDRYYYSLVTLLWFSSVPVIMFYLTTVSKDETRFMCIPFMIAGLVFTLLIVVFGVVVIVYALFDGNDRLTRYGFIACICVLAYSIFTTVFYRYRYSERDLIRTDEEEIDHH